MIKEVSDVLWYVAMLSFELGTTLEEVARVNISKLASRKDRNVLNGSGDNR
jgi:NTP pyrophosphatase (non-canonical NTP hydrolase)